MGKLPLKWEYFKFKSNMKMEYLASEISMDEVKGMNAFLPVLLTKKVTQEKL